MGARPEPVPQVVQTPANSVSALRGEVDDISQAIKALRWERQLQEAQGKQVAAEPSNPLTSSLTYFGSCLCGMPSHSSERKELGGSEMDEKLQAASCKCVCRLLILLSDSYFRLSRAYREDGQFTLALNALEFACLTRDFSLRTFRDFSFRYLSDFSLEEKLEKLKDVRHPKAAEFAWRMRRLTPPPKEEFFPKGLFESHAWILAGDAYLGAQRTFDDSHVAIPHQEEEELKMSQEVKEEVHRVKWIRCKCFNPRSSASGVFLLDRRLPRIVENDWEQNLVVAADCYFNALPCSEYLEWKLEYTQDSESEDTEDEDSENEGSRLMKIACRKLGFVCHECGRRLAELGWHAKDEADKYFRKAIKAFHKGKDLPNFELALCSRIEHHRKLAEFCEMHQDPEGRIKTMEEAPVQYQEALDLCSKAKNRLMKRGDGLHCKEVDREEALTYLKLGMSLLRKGKQEEPNRNGQISAKEAIRKAMNLYNKVDRKQEVTSYSQYQLLDCRLRERLFESDNSDVPVDTEEPDTYLKLGIMLTRLDDNQEEPNRKAAKEAIHEAIDLYKKLDCKQKVAYSQYQLGCVLRDMLLSESDVTRLRGDKLIRSSWLNASEYYLAVRDTDMFLRIRMEHCDLYSAIRQKTQTNKGWEQALIQMLQGCGAVIFDGSSVLEEPFIRKLLQLLRDMCKAAKLPPNIASSSSPSMADDYKFLAEMYRCALKLKGKKDYRPLHNMWKTYASVKSRR
ncbi:hypothetical protein KC19_1G231900 [Ceratodon purpureus]|uniref:Uncharacterized protein n=1 Tax=Ceratodon purpureus TaxID=3225 RepID=A0A8T0JB31_CERPU|nr:hypothetical protein KC19_1G231900 [Ceratodon purpureus]